MFAAALAVTMMLQEAVPERRRGSTLYTNCLAAVREQDGAKDDETTDASSRCIDYFSGFTDGMTMFDNGCFPKNSTLGTLIRLYVVYLQAHPKLMDDERSTGVVMSIADAYPCPKK